MLTTRGWWFLLLSVALVTGAGLVPPRGHTTLVLIGLTLLLWFLAQWLTFVARARPFVGQLLIEREVRDERGPVDSLWSGRSFDVRVLIRCDDWLGLPYVLLTDRVPAGAELLQGETRYEGEVRPGEPIELRYRIFCPSAGQVRFEGVRVQVADLQGFFYHGGFLRDARTCRVLPMLVDAEGRGPTTKRHNLLPPPGVHRLRRPGSGSELLDLRDYLPGDPPKMIAWKVSARRDRLITREFESEVPVRCTLFVDVSNSVRLGPPGRNALARQVEIAAAVAQATVGARDLIGLCLFDEQDSEFVRPARTRQHLTEVLNRLADAAGLAPSHGQASVESLVPTAYRLANEVYPHLLRRDVNGYPFWLAWFSPQPVYTKRHPTFADRMARLPIWVLSAFIAGGVALSFLLPGAYEDDPIGGLLASLRYTTIGIVVSAITLLLTGILGRQRRRLARWRKQLAALISVRHGLAPGGLSLLLEDDDAFALHLQRFLAEHQVPYTLPLYDPTGRYLFAAPAKVEVLSRALAHAVARSHDNELFVLLADLLELPDQLGPLLRTVKVALARHHQVVVICPWPPGVPPPRPGERGPALHLPKQGPPSLEQALRQTTAWRYQESFHRLRRAFARLGVPVLCTQGEDPAPLIVERIDLLRTARFRVRR